MRVLLTESGPGVADESEKKLREAGYDISYCRPDHGPDDGCVVLRGIGYCPLNTDDIALMVDVRASDAPSIAGAREFGAYCAMRHSVPLVVVGPVGQGAPWEYASAVCGADELVGTCQRLTEPVDEAVHRDVERVAREALAANGCDADVEVSVVHAAGSTAVLVRVIGASAGDARAEAAGMIRQTLRGRKDFSEDVTVVLLPEA